MKQTALVVCPGRGTYNKPELGYLARHHSHKQGLVAELDALRAAAGQVPISELDGADRYSAKVHSSSENASLLIYACALADFAAIDRDKFDIVAVTGNSMGWYLALACARALDPQGAATLVNTMGTLMQEQGVGGQIIYPLVDDQWRPDLAHQQSVAQVFEKVASEGVQVFTSIELGGMIVFAADDAGLKFLKEHLPPTDRYPMVLAGHAAFHSKLLAHIPAEAKKHLSQNLFQRPSLPMIDGRGHIWSPRGADLGALHSYTLDHQIRETYRFSRAIEVGIKEFAPDRIIVLGPGTTMGPPVAQELIRHEWYGLTSKDDFAARQKSDPILLSMGLEDQRKIAVSA